MPIIHHRPTPKDADAVAPSQRILQGMHKVLGHDLPNQMVALQSLLHLLDQEESAQLGEDGREYVRRLHSATRRAAGMVRFLKEMSRLDRQGVRCEEFLVAALARELHGEMQRAHPDRSIEFSIDGGVATMQGDPRVFLQALIELCGGVLHPQIRPCKVSASFARRSDTVQLAFHMEEGYDPAAARLAADALEQRMEVILAREWLARAGASLEVELPAPGGIRFAIVVPLG